MVEFLYNFDSRFNISSSASILMFFLAPHEFGVLIILDGVSHIFIREGSNLFDSHNCDILLNYPKMIYD